jgi:hypothetical protein
MKEKEKTMKRYITLLIIALLFASPLAAQEVGSIAFIDTLAGKKQATVGDAVKFFTIAMGKGPAGFAADLKSLQKQNIISNKAYKENQPVRRGAVAYMAAHYLKLGDSLMYIILPMTGRYSYRACIAAEIMTAEGSEYDFLSGAELVEIMRRVSIKSGGAE